MDTEFQIQADLLERQKEKELKFIQRLQQIWTSTEQKIESMKDEYE
jgi:hypothetical protein